ncbi:TetR family transcriptional regulator [Virgibacillus phasianinus]|uniref:TetR family transcriptional regulator n=1 Tax=Virgibacillus phasianinus TaxID=2017483 RepID=A0A220U453_9BACI|nr:TetR/AcrR family transcriptional regulator [Virgibacillus phasianinus]ASK62772.1 TetR family transcriptional regulator [Virgibacillus phasianinus]
MGQRGRKVGASGERSRSLLLQIAADQFAQEGYYNTKISTIVKKAGLTQPTFYLYFQNKDAVFQELVSLFRTKLFSLAESSRLESGIERSALPNQIKAGLTAMFSFFAENPSLTRIGLLQATEAENIKTELAAQITDNLRKEMQDGYFQPTVDVKIVAESLVGIMERLVVTKLLPGIQKPESLANDIVDLLLYGIISKNNG